MENLQMTEGQKNEATRLASEMGIDLSNLPWAKIFIILKFILQVLADQPIPVGHDHDHCDHKALCLEVLCKTSCAQKAALEHYIKCCAE